MMSWLQGKKLSWKKVWSALCSESSGTLRTAKELLDEKAIDDLHHEQFL